MTTSSERGDHPEIGASAAPPPAPAGTVTCLFTDIEGSTRLLHELGESFAGVLEAQRGILRAAFEARGGREVDTAGDGFFVVFGSARDAVEAAAAAQRGLQEHTWPERGRVRVRMGLHTGEPIRAGGSYIGLDVHRASRICDASHGGQVLLSRTTQELVRSEMPEGAVLKDLGEHRLKDIAEPEHLYQLVLSGLPDSFPPLRTIAPRTASLPSPAGPFIGRAEDLATVVDLLVSGAVRLVTLTGPGGTGKTRLAIETATAVAHRFRDGVCFVPLASLESSDLVAATVLGALGLSESGARSSFEAITEHLRDRSTLLLLDNFEHVVGAAGLIAELITACPTTSALVTSRVTLKVTGEREYPVPTLELPDGGSASRGRRQPSPEDLLARSSVALFVDRARAARPGFELTPDNAAAVARVCERVDGLPLALELAAARLKLLSPQELVTRLNSRLDVLKGGARDAPARHRGLRETIALSYDLLTPDQQSFFRRMSVFRGGCTLEAAARVCTFGEERAGARPGSEEEEIDALDALTTLVDHSLLAREEGPAGESRLGMLGTIRDFGMERLQAVEEEGPATAAHSAYFLQFAEEAEPRLTGSEQSTWMDRLETEYDNLRVALQWLEAHDASGALRLAAALWRFWIGRGHMLEGREWLERLIALPGLEDDLPRARALNAAGTIAHEVGDLESAGTHLREGLDIFRALGDKRGAALVLNNLGWTALMSGDVETAARVSGEGLTLSRELDDKRGVAVALNNLAWTAYLQSDFAGAASQFEQSVANRRRIGDLRGSAYGLTYLGAMRGAQGRYEEARAHLEEALALTRQVDDRQGMGNTLGWLGRLTSDLGDSERAVRLLEESTSLFREVGNPGGVAESLTFLGLALLGAGRPAEARAALEEVLDITRKVDVPWMRAEALCGMAWVATKEARVEDALACAERSMASRRRTRDDRGVAECLEVMAHLAAQRSDAVTAARYLGAAEMLRGRVGAPLPPRSQAWHADLVRRLQEELGAARLSEEWRVGADSGAPAHL